MDDRQRLLCLYLLYLKRKKRRNKGRKWVHPLNIQRPVAGAFVVLFNDLRSDESKFLNYFGMSMPTFDDLLIKVQGQIVRQNTNMRDAISPTERLAVTLRYLASGNTFTDLHYVYRMGISTISEIVSNVCDVLWSNLHQECMPPLTMENLESVACEFERKTQFPHCIGAVDGKHIRLVKTEHSGAHLSNYKENFSVFLLAVVDSQYRFLFVDIGAYEKDCDSSVFKETKFWKSIVDETLPLPKPKPLSTSNNQCVPYVLLGDDGFGIYTNMMRPFAGKQCSIEKRIFNYRLRRAKRYVECAFGILSNKWRIFHRPLNVKEELAVKIVKACCILHNFVMVRDGYNFEDTLTVVGFNDVKNCGIRRGKKAGENVRNMFADYFMSNEGSVPWQNRMV